jgi:NAD(P)-dependent dehydrogenase (short-subunit alcohol dehydrogenase family)
LALCSAFERQGAIVYIADISGNAPQALQNRPNIHFVGKCDITSRAACHDFINAIPGRLDGLVNCAGICPIEGKMASDEIFTKIMSVNVVGTWNMGTEAISRMTQQESQAGVGLLPGTERTLGAGRIVNFASGAGLRGIAGLGAYCTSKHAVVGMTRSWAKEWPTLRVNAVAPGK